MTIEQLLFALGGLSISIISFFLKRTLNELEKIKEVAYDTKNRLNVLENDYTNKVHQLNEKIDDLQEVIKELTHELKTFNKEINKKNT
jgi:peptidoglycan hydrolase CwlO-like protein